MSRSSEMVLTEREGGGTSSLTILQDGDVGKGLSLKIESHCSANR